jgi:hypothetical protein
MNAGRWHEIFKESAELDGKAHLRELTPGACGQQERSNEHNNASVAK